MFQAQYNYVHSFYEEPHKLIFQGQIVNGLIWPAIKESIHVAYSDVLEKTIEITIWSPNI